MGFGVNNDRRGYQDPWDGALMQQAIQPVLPKVTPNPLLGPATKPAPPFTEVEIAGRKYLGYPWRVTGRIVLPANGSNTAADSIAIAEGLASAEAQTTAAICSFNVPQAMIAMATKIRVRFGDNTALQKVKLQLVSGGTQATSVQSGDSGLVVAGEQQSFVQLDDEIDVLMRARPDTCFKLLAINSDTEVPHYMEGELEGVYFPMSVLLPLGPEPKT